MTIFNYIINKLDLRIRKPSQAKPSDNFKIFTFPCILFRAFFYCIFYEGA